MRVMHQNGPAILGGVPIAGLTLARMRRPLTLGARRRASTTDAACPDRGDGGS